MRARPRTKDDAISVPRSLTLSFALAATLLFDSGAVAQTASPSDPAPVLLDNMDGSAPALKLLNPGSNARVVSQDIEPGTDQQGNASERLRLAVAAGSSAMLAYDIPHARVIDELRLTAWIFCNRPGVRLAANVVLPRSIDPKTSRPRELLVRAENTAAGGSWEQVNLESLPRLLADRARVARASRLGEIDEREAYVSQLIFLAPGGPGETEFVVDLVTIHGLWGGAPSGPTASAATLVNDSIVQQAAAEMPVATAGPIGRSVKRPPVPRIIQWQGEPPEMLQRLGFDAVWMGRLPTEEELAEVTRLGMFIVCPPPSPEALSVEGIGPRYAPVLAWDLGQLAEEGDVQLAHRWAQAIEIHERDAVRPVLLEPFGMAREASRIADVVMLGRPTLGTTQTWMDYAGWLSQQRRIARQGTAVWVNVETHCGPRFMAQLAALRGGERSVIVPATFQEMSRATMAAFGVMPRGFCFQSHASLAGGDVENRQRALAMELTNLRLGLVEPWLAAGKAATAARSTRPDITGLVLKVERSHLIIPLRWDDGRTESADGHSPGGMSFDLPGVPESCDAYLASVSGSQRLEGRRVTGGLRISIEHLPDDAFVLVTEDGYAFSHVERYLRQHAPRATQVRVELAALRRQQAAQAIAKAPAGAVEASGIQQELKQVDSQMTKVVETMRSRDYAAAFACATEAERLLDVALERLAATVAPTLPPGTSPAPTDWSTVGELAAAAEAIGRATTPWQLIPGGEFEDLESLTGAGWQRVQNPPVGVEAAVRLSPESPARGGYCLELDATSKGAGGNPPVLSTPPVWVTSPAIRVPAGHLVEITGVARVGEVPIGSPDPLLIFDSVGGEESAVRVRTATSWEPFRLVRAATPGSELRVTIALGGVGRAQVDSLAYRFVPIGGDAVARVQGPR